MMAVGPGSPQAAARAASLMRAALGRVGHLRTSVGPVLLRASSGVATGQVHLVLAGDPAVHRELMVLGPVGTRMTAVEACGGSGPGPARRADRGCAAGAPRRRAGGAGTHPSRAATSLVAADGGGVVASGGARWPLAVPVVGPDLPGTARTPTAPTSSPPTCAPTSRPARTSPSTAWPRPPSCASAARTGSSRTRVPAALATAVDDLVRTIQDATTRHGVSFHETDVDGDGGKIMLIAGAPQSTGDDVDHLLAAVRMVVDRPHRLSVRVGVAQGRVFTGDLGPAARRTYSVKGGALNLAARLAARAEPGTVVVPVDLLQHSRTEWALGPTTAMGLKGLKQPVRTATLGAATGRPVGRSETAMVGRDAELARLTAALERLGDGTGGVVTVVAQPGMGKTRLVTEVVAGAADFRVLIAECGHSGTSAPYATVRTLVAQALGLTADLSPAQALERAAAVVAPTHPHLLGELPMLGLVLGAPPDRPARRTADRARRRRRRPTSSAPRRCTGWSSRCSRPPCRTPRSFVVEDAHLMDGDSARVLARVAGRCAELPWLVLTTRRELDLQVTGGGGGHRAGPPRPGRQRGPHGPRRARPPAPAHHRARARRAGRRPPPLPARAGAGDVARRPARRPAAVGRGARGRPGRRTGAPPAVAAATSRRPRRLVHPHPARRPRGGRRRGLAARRRRGALGLPRAGRRPQVAVPARRAPRDGVCRAADEGAHATARAGRRGPVPVEPGAAGGGPRCSRTTSSRPAATPTPGGAPGVAGAKATAAAAPEAAAHAYAQAAEAALRSGTVDSTERALDLEAWGDALFLCGRSGEADRAYAQARRLWADVPLSAAAVVLKAAKVAQRQGRHPVALRRTAVGLRLVDGTSDPAAVAVRRPAPRPPERGPHEPGPLHRGGPVRRPGRHRSPRRPVRTTPWRRRTSCSTAWRSSPARPRRWTTARPALRLYEALGDVSGQAHAHNNIAMRQLLRGRWSEAQDGFRRAARDFDAVGDAANAANAAYNSADLLNRQGRPEQALELLSGVLRIARAVGDEELRALVLARAGPGPPPGRSAGARPRPPSPRRARCSRRCTSRTRSARPTSPWPRATSSPATCSRRSRPRGRPLEAVRRLGAATPAALGPAGAGERPGGARRPGRRAGLPRARRWPPARRPELAHERGFLLAVRARLELVERPSAPGRARRAGRPGRHGGRARRSRYAGSGWSRRPCRGCAPTLTGSCRGCRR